MEIALSLQHVAEMLRDRGDDTTTFETEAAAIEPARFYTELVQLETDTTQIFYCLTKDALKDLIKELKELDPTAMVERWGHTRFIAIERPSQTNTSIFEEKDKGLLAQNGYFQLFDLKHLLYNPANHVYTPKHVKLTDDEVKALLESYQLKNRFLLPSIMRTDIMARWLGLRHGDVVRITRHTPTSGDSDYFRCCM